MSKKVYDILRDIAQVWLPASGTLYFTLAAIWGLPYADEIAKTVVAVDTFLGAILKLDSIRYQKSLKVEVDE